MASRKWTVVVLPDGEGSVRQFRLSREVVRSTIAIALFTVASLTGLASASLRDVGAARAESRAIAKNQVLEQNLAEMTERLHELEGSLAALTARDAHYRLLAGLDPLDADVLMAGIGGPDGDTLEASDLYDIDESAATTVFDASMDLNALTRRAGVLASSWREAERALEQNHERLAATPSIFPTQGYLSSSFSRSRLHPILHRARPHLGLDISAPIGTPVVAPAAGRVRFAGRRGDYGQFIEIDHGHGVVTRYAHLSKLGVKVGQSVRRGDEIGAVGNSGLSAGPHLHYEVLVNGRHVNPRTYIIESDVLPD